CCRRMAAGALSPHRGVLQYIPGACARSEAVIRPGLELLIREGEKSFLSPLAPTLGWLLARGGQLDEAEDLAIMGRDAAPPDDFASQVAWRQAMGWVLAGRGRLDEADAILRDAMTLFEGVDYLT